MRNNKLIQLLLQLNKRELKELREFVTYELFHPNKKQYNKVLMLFQQIISPQFKVRKLEREVLEQRLFGNNHIERKKLNHYLSWAIDLVHKYMIFKYQSTNPLHSNITLLMALQERKMGAFFQQLKTKIQGLLSKKKPKISSDFYHSFQVANIGLSYKGIRGKEMTDEKEEFKEAIGNLDLFFLFHQLSYACYAINTRRAVNAPEYEFPILDHIIDALPNMPYGQLPRISMYWNAYKMLRTDEEPYYQSLKKLLIEHYSILSSKDYINLFKYLQNYCACQIRDGQNKYYEEYWDIAVFQLDKGLLENIQQPIYKNLVTVGTMLAVLRGDNDFNAVHQFLEQHTDKLQEKIQGDAKQYATAYVAFYQNEFHTVIGKLLLEKEPLVLFKFEDLYYQVDARRLLIMTYFCLRDENRFDKMCNNLGVFLSDRKDIISPIEVEKNRQFLIFSKRIFWAIIDQSSKKSLFRQIKKEIEACKTVSDKTWLLNQIRLNTR